MKRFAPRLVCRLPSVLILTLLFGLLSSVAHAQLSQTSFPASGGTLSVSTSSPGPNFISTDSDFELLDSSGGIVTGTNAGYEWSGSLNVPANSSQTQPVIYTVVLHAYYRYNSGGTVYSGYDDFSQGSITVAPDDVAPTLSGTSVSATSFPASGGRLSVSTSPSDPNVGLISHDSDFELLDSSGGIVTGTNAGNEWSGGLNVPANSSRTQSVTYTLVLHIYDSVDNYWYATLATITVAPDDVAPTLSGTSVSATSFPASGGRLSVSTSPSDPNVGLISHDSDFELLDSSGGIVTGTNAGNEWSGGLNVPANSSRTQSVTYTLVLHIYDSVDNYWYATLATITVAPDDVAPTLSGTSVSATSFPASGGRLSVSTSPSDPNVGLISHDSDFELLDSSGGIVTGTNAGGGWSGGLNVPANSSQTQSVTYTLVLHIYDSVGNYWDVTIATITVVATDQMSTAVASLTGFAGQTVTLSATLQKGGVAQSGKTLTFSVDGTTVGTAVTGSSGTASLSYTIPANAAAGGHPISVSFAGDSGDAASSGTGTLTVTTGQVNTVVTVGTRTGAHGTTVSLKSTLKTSGGAVLSGRTLTYLVNGVAAGSAVTDSTGLASLNYAIPASAPAGNEPIAVSFAGDGGDNPSSGTGTLTVTGSALSTSVTVAAASGAPGQTVSLSATLKAGMTLLSGKALTFQVDGVTVGTAVTSSSGVASLSYAIPAGDAPGSHTVTVSFAGDSGDAASSGTGTLTVTGASKLNTVVTVGARSGKAGTTVSLKAYLKTSGGAVLVGKTLTYTVNGVAAGSAVTDSTGLATLSYTIPASAPAGNEPIVVSFGGDSGDNASSGKGTLTVS